MWRCTKIDKYEVYHLVRWSPIQSCFAPFGLGLLSVSDWPLAWVTLRGTQNTSINSTRITFEKLIRHLPHISRQHQTLKDAIRHQQTPANAIQFKVCMCLRVYEYSALVWCSKWGILVRLEMHLFWGENYKNLWFYALFYIFNLFLFSSWWK